MKLLALSAGLLLATVPTIGTAQTAPTAPAKAAVPAPDADKKICRRDTATGSIMTKRTCRTRTEWAEIDAQNASNAQAAMDRRSHSLGRNGG